MTLAVTLVAIQVERLGVILALALQVALVVILVAISSDRRSTQRPGWAPKTVVEVVGASREVQTVCL